MWCRHSDVALHQLQNVRSEMEPLLPLIITAAIVLFIVAPAIWSRDPMRRADARDVLRILLSAFGRRAV